MRSGRTGFTTGTCAAAAAKAAAMRLCGHGEVRNVEVSLPDGARVTLPVEAIAGDLARAQASVRKDAGDDPDVTDKCLITAQVEWAGGADLSFVAGEGVGIITRPGLSVPMGEAAINPVPRRMIGDAVREVTDRGLRITISIPGGKELAKKTFNPRLGIEGGLSILGTSGIVRPFSCPALRDALKCALGVAMACNITSPVLVPGRIGEKVARRLFHLSVEQLIEVSNEWGFMVDQAAKCNFERIMALGHPGKLAKIMAGSWDTHSSRSGSALPAVRDLAHAVLGYGLSDATTVEGLFGALPEPDRRTLADALASRVRNALFERLMGRVDVAVVLVSMQGALLGTDGNLGAWQWKTRPSR